ncbi:MAG: YvcK family protein [Actinomycetota bacterium]|nr:YvcK family protein [Actinomycetota bacterium]
MSRVESDLEVEAELSPLELGWSGPKVVAIGGGHGLAQLLEGVLRYAGEIAAVVTVADDGGSSGRLTSVLEIPPPGDLRRCLLALSPEPTLWRELFAYRFEEGDVAGHSLGNLMLAALTEVLGDFEAALRAAASHLRSLGRVIPVARRSLHLQAVIDGQLVEGQESITRARGEVSKLSLVPVDEPANPEALEAIAAADQLVVAPGSLYTSVLSALIVPGIVEAIGASAAPLVYVCNLITQDGETLEMDGPAHLEALLGMSGLRVPDAVVANGGEVQAPWPLQLVRVHPGEVPAEVIVADLVDRAAEWPQHDPIRLGEVLSRLT